MANHVILFSAWFQHTAARRRLGRRMVARACRAEFQHTAARRRLVAIWQQPDRQGCFNTQPPEGGWVAGHGGRCYVAVVSTHSRPKAAGPQQRQQPNSTKFQHTAARRRLGCPPPMPPNGCLFQHTAARRRLDPCHRQHRPQPQFQHTAARRRLAELFGGNDLAKMFQHTAARRRLVCSAGCQTICARCFNTQPPEGGWGALKKYLPKLFGFQHTAARRRLDRLSWVSSTCGRFNTQPPEGGWGERKLIVYAYYQFQHTAARRRLDLYRERMKAMGLFQHTAARRRLGKTCRIAASDGSFNTQPPEGGWHPDSGRAGRRFDVSTHSRPKAAGKKPPLDSRRRGVSTHSRPKAAGAA